MSDPERDVSQESPRARARRVVGSLAHDFRNERWSKGDIAQFRRLDAKRRQASDLAFWRLAATVLEPENLLDEGSDESLVRKWMAVVQGLAVIYELHAPKHRLGRALHQADVSERRLIRLLRADGDGLLTETRRVARQLHSRGQSVDWRDAATLLLSEGEHDHERIRRYVASDYYHQQHQSETDDAKQTT